MSKSNNRKVYAALLGVAVAGFIVDRALLGGGFGPDAALAAETNTAPVAEPSPRQPQARLSERVAAAFEQAARQPAVVAASTTPDLFDPTAAFGPQSEAKTREALQQEFLRTHRLTALSDNVVVINGVTLKLNQGEAAPMIDGYRLTGIYRQESAGSKQMGVTLVKDDVTIQLPFNPAQSSQADR